MTLASILAPLPFSPTAPDADAVPLPPSAPGKKRAR